jgi:hypothetical protein
MWWSPDLGSKTRQNNWWDPCLGSEEDEEEFSGA